jgi:hypothetical protein
MSREPRLARVFVELADTLVAEFDVIDFLHTLADRSVEMLGAEAAGLMLADQRGNLQLIASSAESARLLEVFELQNAEGPCLDCFRTGEQLVNLDDAIMQSRWPSFWAETKQLGFGSAHALPMRLREQVIGAINLFGRPGAALSEQDVAIGQAMADVATIGLLQERSVHQKEVLAEQLQTALNSRILIEQAKGVLAERAQVPIEKAFTLMRAHARKHKRTLSGVAIDLVNGALTAAELQASEKTALGGRT